MVKSLNLSLAKNSPFTVLIWQIVPLLILRLSMILPIYFYVKCGPLLALRFMRMLAFLTNCSLYVLKTSIMNFPIYIVVPSWHWGFMGFKNELESPSYIKIAFI